MNITQPFLDSLTEDENAVLHYLYHLKSTRLVDLRCVRVVPLYDIILSTTYLNNSGKLIAISLVTKLSEEYGLPLVIRDDWQEVLDQSSQPPLSSEFIELSGYIDLSDQVPVPVLENKTETE